MLQSGGKNTMFTNTSELIRTVSDHQDRPEHSGSFHYHLEPAVSSGTYIQLTPFSQRPTLIPLQNKVALI